MPCVQIDHNFWDLMFFFRGEWKIAWFIPWTFFCLLAHGRVVNRKLLSMWDVTIWKDSLRQSIPFFGSVLELKATCTWDSHCQSSFVFYHLPTKLREVNAFSRVWLFTVDVPCDHYTHDAFHLTIHGFPPRFSGCSLPPSPTQPPPDIGPHCAGTVSPSPI